LLGKLVVLSFKSVLFLSEPLILTTKLLVILLELSILIFLLVGVCLDGVVGTLPLYVIIVDQTHPGAIQVVLLIAFSLIGFLARSVVNDGLTLGSLLLKGLLLV